MSRRIVACPICDAPLRVTELSCTVCRTRLQGDFPPPPLARLSAEHQSFIETFVLCRGVIRDVERALGISYPTVRARLDAVVDALDTVLEAQKAGDDREERRRNLLRQVEEGTVTPEQAAELLRKL
jgi:hypothetical protein